jgi:hypothetical protein
MLRGKPTGQSLSILRDGQSPYRLAYNSSPGAPVADVFVGPRLSIRKSPESGKEKLWSYPKKRGFVGN